MIRRCMDAGLPEPDFTVSDGFVTIVRRAPAKAVQVAGEVAPEVTPEVRLMRVLRREMTRKELQQALGLRDDEHFRTAYLLPALEAGLIEMTLPDKPTSRLQSYRLTDKGRAASSSLPPTKPT